MSPDPEPRTVSTSPMVVLIAGPAGAGKTTTAARIAERPGWVHLSEDDHWVQIKVSRPPGELRTSDEQDVVQRQVTERILEHLSNGTSVVLEFILYEDPPLPLLRYQQAFADHGVTVLPRILRPTVDEILRRIGARGRPNDLERTDLRRNVEHQVSVLASPQISPDWVIDSTDLTLEEVYVTHFEPIVEQQD